MRSGKGCEMSEVKWKWGKKGGSWDGKWEMGRKVNSEKENRRKLTGR